MLMILIHYQHSYSWSDGRLFSKKLEICRILLICSMHTPLWAECHSYVFKPSEVCQKYCLCICNFIASLKHPSEYFSYLTHYISSSKSLVVFIATQWSIFCSFLYLVFVWPHTLFSTHYSKLELKVKLFSSGLFPWWVSHSEWMVNENSITRNP